MSGSRWVNGRREGPGKMVAIFFVIVSSLLSSPYLSWSSLGVEHRGGVRGWVEEQLATGPGETQVKHTVKTNGEHRGMHSKNKGKTIGNHSEDRVETQ